MQSVHPFTFPAPLAVLQCYQIELASKTLFLDPCRFLRTEVFRTFHQISIAKILYTLELFFRRIPAIVVLKILKIRKLENFDLAEYEWE